MITFKINAATPSLNEILRWKANRQWWRYSQLRDSYCIAIRARMNELGHFGRKPAGKMHVTVTRCCAGSGLDDDNFRGGCKPLLDAMRLEGLIVDDSPKWLEADYIAKKAPTGKGYVQIDVELAEEQPKVTEQLHSAVGGR